MSFFKKALCAAAVSGLALSSPAMAAPKSVVKVAAKDVRASSKVKKAQRAIGAEGVVILVIGGASVIAGVAAATGASK